ncbi:histidine kinase [Caldinitratiruptor microaerophilus]|uniref:histidine kinase n=1 Tax=Caldinitratiruptor microaerophilus TaxID=671077 RepID=A0AA35CKE8_9FIRM|nr:histidine kinase [Caldinitratiruptor microaerophilus]BDG60915.1 histidine kinase [Caldinitratiruptor microaerophilus]
MGINRKYRILYFLLAITGAGVAALLLAPWGGAVAALALVLQLVVAVGILSAADPTPRPPSSSELESLSNSFDATLRISGETLPYLRQGLNEESAQKITELMRRITEVDAVAITDTEKILGFSGVGCRRHQQGGPILTDATREVLRTGQPKVVVDPRVLSCDEPGCPHPLKSAVIAPLKFRGRVVGTFKLYRTQAQALPPHVARLAVGIAQILDMQMELAEAERQRQLVTKARLEALQAQIRPHFLFNVLNTIIHFSRTDVEKARELLVQLASFFRRSLSYRGNFITLQEELEYINTYLALEKARYGDKLRVRMRIDPKVLSVPIPILTLQPLVENSVVHGIAPLEGGGTVGMLARRVRDEIHVLVYDTGVGMDRETVERVFRDGYGTGMGLGLTNVNDRLVSLYGEAYRLRVRSAPGKGTAIRVRIPLRAPAGAAADGDRAPALAPTLRIPAEVPEPVVTGPSGAGQVPA